MLRIIEGILSTQQKEWAEKFCEIGGLEHLFDFLMNWEKLYKPLDRKCTSMLMKVILMLQNMGFSLNEWIDQHNDNKKETIDKILNILNACSRNFDTSLRHKEEKTDEVSSTSVQDKIEEQLKDEAKNFEYGISLIMNEKGDYFEYIAKYPNLKNLLVNSLILTENYHIKETLKSKIKVIFSSYKDVQYSDTHPHIVLVPIMIQDMVKETLKNYQCESFYRLLCFMIEELPEQYKETKLSVILSKEMNNIVTYIKNYKPIPGGENNLIYQLMLLLDKLIDKFPDSKNEIAKELLDKILYEFLFAFPDSKNNSQYLSSVTLKCESQELRQVAFKMLLKLSRDSPAAISKILEFFTPMHTKASWRNCYMSDWYVRAENEGHFTTGFAGIKNLDNTCYMNSLLQLLYMIPSFRNDVLEAVDCTEVDKTDKHRNLLYQMQCLFKALNQSVQKTCDAEKFFNAMQDLVFENYNLKEQRDIEEFFYLLVKELSIALSNTQHKDTIERHFGGVFQSQIGKKECSHTIIKSESFLTIDLGIKNKRTLQESLESFTSEQTVEGTEPFVCKQCNKKVTITQQTTFKKLPEYLIFALKRFDFEESTKLGLKIHDYYEFPNEINMLNYSQREIGELDKEKVPQSTKEKECYDYKLKGVVIYRGIINNLQYYSLIADREDKAEQWYKFDDTYVDKFELGDMKEEAFGREDERSRKQCSACLLLYERINKSPEEKSVQEELTGKISDLSKQLNKRIQKENIKYWHRRYIFHSDYFEFVIKLAESWNSKESITSEYLTRNQDQYLNNKELVKDNSHKSKETEEISLAIGKYLLTVFLTTVVHFQDKTRILEFIGTCKAYLNKHLELSQWLISQFTNTRIIKEFLFDCPATFSTRFVAGLVHCAILNVYNPEREAIANGNTENSLILNFANGLLNEIAKQSQSNINYCFQILSQLLFIGPEIRSTLSKQGALKTLLDFLLVKDKKSKDDCFKWKENENVEIGLTKYNTESIDVSSEDIQEHTKSSNHFLIEAISLLLRTTWFDGNIKSSPFKLEGCEGELDEEVKSVLENPENIKELHKACSNHFAYIKLTEALAHISWENIDLKKVIIEGTDLSRMNLLNVDIHGYFIRTIVRYEKILQEEMISKTLDLILEKSNQEEKLAYIKFLVTLIEDVPEAESWLLKSKDKWKQIHDWLNNVTSRMLTENNMQSLDQYKELIKNAKEYMEYLESVKEGNTINKSKLNINISTMYYRKFVEGKKVECYNARKLAWERLVITRVFDELVIAQKNQSPFVAIFLETNHIAEVGTHTKDELDNDEAVKYPIEQ